MGWTVAEVQVGSADPPVPSTLSSQTNVRQEKELENMGWSGAGVQVGSADPPILSTHCHLRQMSDSRKS